MTTEKIKAAEAKVKACMDRAAEHELAFQAARNEAGEARKELASARMELDMTLPKAQVKKTERFGRAKLIDVVIVKNNGKTAFVREPGVESDGGQYRLGKNGQWRPYPKLDSWEGWRELIIEGGAS